MRYLKAAQNYTDIRSPLFDKVNEKVITLLGLAWERIYNGLEYTTEGNSYAK